MTEEQNSNSRKSKAGESGAAGPLSVVPNGHQLHDPLSDSQKNEVRLIIITYMAIAFVALFGTLLTALTVMTKSAFQPALEEIESRKLRAETIVSEIELARAEVLARPRRVVALMSDFGSNAYYMAALRGTILNAFSDTNLVDISQEVTQFDVAEGAWTLYKAAEYFPDGTVFVAIVNPGADLERSRYIETEQRHFTFIGADHAVFDHVAKNFGVARAHRLAPTRVDDTFGTKTFFPIIEGVMKGLSTKDLVSQNLLGQELDLSSGYPFELRAARIDGRIERNRALGNVSAIDRWGNIQTTIPFHGNFFNKMSRYDVTITVNAYDSDSDGDRVVTVVSLENLVYGRSYDAGKKEPGVIIQQDGLIQVAKFLTSLESHIVDVVRSENGSNTDLRMAITDSAVEIVRSNP